MAIGFIIGTFELAGWFEAFVGLVEQRVGQWPADALVEKNEHECCFGALFGEPVTIGSSDAFEQTVGFQFANVVAELVQGITVGGQGPRSRGRFDGYRPSAIR